MLSIPVPNKPDGFCGREVPYLLTIYYDKIQHAIFVVDFFVFFVFVLISPFFKLQNSTLVSDFLTR